jgi:deoxyribodipyrimidine photo-lyase
MSAALVWFRRDLRLADNPALAAAVATGLPVVSVYVHAPDEEAPWAPGAASNWWLHHSLAALDGALRARGSRLIVRRGPTATALDTLIAETDATIVVWNRLYEPAIVSRDTAIKASLRGRGIEARSFNAGQLVEPWDIETGGGGPYRVFTPFWRNLSARLAPTMPTAVPASLATPPLPSVPLDDLGLRPTIPWDVGFSAHWTPGEAGAIAALETFLDGAVGPYASDRDRPDRPGTSRLSPHLHFGEIGPRQIVHALHQLGLGERAAPFVRELGWREFSTHLLHHFPHTSDAPLNAAFEGFPWAEPDPGHLQAWQRGRTGIPIVDAGMRELWSTGWMHNRVRMIVASFLTKNLRYHWLHGARWFWDTLVDADLPNNTQGWQWSAGSGADAAPYFRIFNPVLQGERFDPEGTYVKRHVPELARLPAKSIHKPWTLRPAELTALGLAGTVWASPIVDLAASREAALAAYHGMRRGERT